ETPRGASAKPMPATSVREHVGQPVSGRGVLFRAIRDSGWSTVVLAGAALAGAAAELALPAAMGRTVDTVVRGAGAGTGPWRGASPGVGPSAGPLPAILGASAGSTCWPAGTMPVPARGTPPHRPPPAVPSRLR